MASPETPGDVPAGGSPPAGTGQSDEAKRWLRDVERHAKGVQRLRRMLRNLPSDPRCRVCYAPFGGPGGLVMGAAGRRPSRKNPHLCARCVEEAPPVSVETTSGILFGDVRGYTSLAETRSPAQVGALMERFYDVAARAVIDHDGILDKLVGDEVMGVFWPPFMTGDPCGSMLSAAEDLLRGVGYGRDDPAWLPVGVGLDYGDVQLGNIGAGQMRDFTALGDVVNTAARLQANADGGEILMSARVYEKVRERYPNATRRELALKGKSGPTTAFAISVGVTAAV